jgi:hypothetical protein
MDYYAGIDVSLKESSVCVVDARGRLFRRVRFSKCPETSASCGPVATLSGSSSLLLADNKTGHSCAYDMGPWRMVRVGLRIRRLIRYIGPA